MYNNTTFPKKFRLLNSKHFCYVFEQSQRISIKSNEITIISCRNKLSYPRLGISFAKNSVKLAHERNRVKRLIRDYFRLHKYKFQSMDFIIIARKEVINLDNHHIINILGTLWHHHYRLAQD